MQTLLHFVKKCLVDATGALTQLEGLLEQQGRLHDTYLEEIRTSQYDLIIAEEYVNSFTMLNHGAFLQEVKERLNKVKGKASKKPYGFAIDNDEVQVLNTITRISYYIEEALFLINHINRLHNGTKVPFVEKEKLPEIIVSAKWLLAKIAEIYLIHGLAQMIH